jgi:hypothetical protein
MLRQNRIIQALKSKSGASMLFVLGIMLTLLFISTSVLVAASAAAGAAVSRRINNQLELYADGIQKAIHASLQASDKIHTNGGDLNKDVFGSSLSFEQALQTLGGQLIKVMYDNATATSLHFVSQAIDPITGLNVGFNNDPDLGFDGTVNIEIVSSVVSFDRADENGTLVPTQISPGVFELLPMYEPHRVQINAARVIITVVVERGTRRITSVVEYGYSGGLLESPTDPAAGGGYNQLLIVNAGEWEFVSHEKSGG